MNGFDFGSKRLVRSLKLPCTPGTVGSGSFSCSSPLVKRVMGGFGSCGCCARGSTLSSFRELRIGRLSSGRVFVVKEGVLRTTIKNY